MSAPVVAPTEAEWQELVARLRTADTVVCVAHVSPDGDAIGSALAVAIALDALGINAVASFDEDPFRLPDSLAWLPRQELLKSPESLPERASVVVSFDASDAARLGAMADFGARSDFFAAVDHHRSHVVFADLAIVNVSAPATAVMALELVDQLGVDLTPELATCLYVGLTTDTGSFRFAGTTSDTHRLAARLHDAGIAHDDIARRVFDTHSVAALKLLAVALQRLKLEATAARGSGLVWTWLSKQDRRELGLGLDAAEPIIDTVRTAAEAEIAVVCKEGDDGVWRVSTRSKGEVDVGQMCASLGGGGHKFAAGFSAHEAPEQIIATVLEYLA